MIEQTGYKAVLTVPADCPVLEVEIEPLLNVCRGLNETYIRLIVRKHRSVGPVLVHTLPHAVTPSHNVQSSTPDCLVSRDLARSVRNTTDELALNADEVIPSMSWTGGLNQPMKLIADDPPNPLPLCIAHELSSNSLNNVDGTAPRHLPDQQRFSA